MPSGAASQQASEPLVTSARAAPRSSSRAPASAAEVEDGLAEQPGLLEIDIERGAPGAQERQQPLGLAGRGGGDTQIGRAKAAPCAISASRLSVRLPSSAMMPR